MSSKGKLGVAPMSSSSSPTLESPKSFTSLSSPPEFADAKEVPGLLVAVLVDYVFNKDSVKTYVAYKIDVRSAGLKWSVFKRFSEFEDLHYSLQKSFPLIKLPEFPDPHLSDEIKTLFNKKWALEDAFIEKRKVLLKTYLTELQNREEIVLSKDFLEFVGALEDHSEQPKSKAWDSPHGSLHFDRFLEIVDAGDIILYHTPGMVSSAYRSVIGSYWDHVAMVVYNPGPSFGGGHKKFRLLEATVDGVHQYPLAARMKLWKSSYPDMELSIRKLKANRDATFKAKMAEFLEKCEGASYSLKGFLSTKDPELDKATWFCSELVAMCYRHVGVFTPDSKPQGYQPMTFAKPSEDLDFVPGCELSEIILLRFSKIELSTAEDADPAEESFSTKPLPLYPDHLIKRDGV